MSSTQTFSAVTRFADRDPHGIVLPERVDLTLTTVPEHDVPAFRSPALSLALVAERAHTSFLLA